MLEDDSGNDVSSVCSENNVSYQQSSSDSEIDEVVPSAFPDTHEPIRTAKDGTKWVQLHQPVAGRVSTANIFSAIPGIASASIKASVTTPYDAWKQFINECMLKNVLKCTIANSNEQKFSLTINELERFISL